MPLRDNVAQLVEKLLEEEVARLPDEDDDDSDGLDGGDDMVGGLDEQSSEGDVLGFNKAKATV